MRNTGDLVKGLVGEGGTASTGLLWHTLAKELEEAKMHVENLRTEDTTPGHSHLFSALNKLFHALDLTVVRISGDERAQFSFSSKQELADCPDAALRTQVLNLAEKTTRGRVLRRTTKDKIPATLQFHFWTIYSALKHRDINSVHLKRDSAGVLQVAVGRLEFAARDLVDYIDSALEIVRLAASAEL